MKYANTIQEVLTFMTTEPLKREELDDFYVETMPVRTGNPYKSPMTDIIRSCRNPSEHKPFLLLGHTGCGKSTELNYMSRSLEKEGFSVYTIPCKTELDPNHISYEDLLILMGDALLTIVEQKNISIEPSLIQEIQDFWRVSTEQERTQVEQLGIDNAFGFEGVAGIPGFVKAFLNIKARLKYEDVVKTVYRGKIERNSSRWLLLLRKVTDQISLHEGHAPVLVFEDLDKMDAEIAWNVFSNHASKLSGLSCMVVFTFPISLFYEPKFSNLDTFFSYQTLPMIKITTPDGEPFEEGYQKIREIIGGRMNTEALFDDGVLNYLIEKTGGALRDLFRAIRECAGFADTTGATTINMDFAGIALEEIKSTLTRRIERKNYAFLAEIYNGNREKIEDKKMLLEMLQAGVVLEYNGTRWHNVHPLIGDFLVEQGLT